MAPRSKSVRDTAASLFVQWDGSTWTGETTNFVKAVGRSQQISRSAGWIGVGTAGTSEATITLHNNDGRYSPTNTNSAISASISAGQFRNRKLKVDVEVDNSSCTIFTGYIRDLRQQAANNSVQFVCQDRATLLADQRLSTCLYTNIYTGCYVKTVLEDAGLAASDMIIDNGYTRLPFAWMDDESVWEELGMVAEVEGGRVYIDQLGRVVFEDSTGLLISGSQL